MFVMNLYFSPEYCDKIIFVIILSYFLKLSKHNKSTFGNMHYTFSRGFVFFVDVLVLHISSQCVLYVSPTNHSNEGRKC